MLSLRSDLTAPAPEVDSAGALAMVLAAFGLPVELVEPVAPVEPVEMTRADVARLLAAWRAWARSPGSARAANALESACRYVASTRGTTATAVRLWMLANLGPLGLDTKGGRP